MKKHTFVPSADSLESRIALSGGIKSIGGVPVLTTSAIKKAQSLIQQAYTTFATKGQNYSLLSFNLSKASNLIPFARRDTTPTTGATLFITLTQLDVANLKLNIQNKVASAVVTEYKQSLADSAAFIAQEVHLGLIVIR
jgi:hypothetical protein